MFLSIFRWFRRLSLLISSLIGLAVWGVITLGIIWAIGAWYSHQQREQPISWGMSWSSKQAEQLKLSPIEGLDKLLSQLPFKRVQLMSYWDELELQNNTFNFESLEQQFMIAKGRNVKISLQLGLHQSRWPYCHSPKWAENLDKEEFKLELKQYLKEIIAHFDNDVNLIQYQLEPEIFRAKSDSCPQQLNRSDLEEIHLFVKDLTEKEISLSRPNNLAVWRQQKPEPDSFGLQLTPHPDNLNWPINRIRQTPPSQYYTFVAGNLRILHSESNIFIRDLKAEPTAFDNNLAEIDLNSEKFTLRPDQLSDRLNYARKTNIKTIDLKGAEWWLWQEEKGDNRFLETVRSTILVDF